MFNIICAIISVVCGCVSVGFILVGWERMKATEKTIAEINELEQKMGKGKTTIKIKRDAS